MIAGNLVEIRLPKIQSRKCLRKSNLWRYSRKCLQKFNFNEIRSPELSAYNLPQPKEFFPSTMFEIFSSALAYRFFDLFVGCGVFSLCNLLLSPFLCLNCFTNTLEYYPKNYASVKCKTDLKLFCYNHPGCVCSVNYWRFIQKKTHFVKH
jgi:hypothetical protein